MIQTTVSFIVDELNDYIRLRFNTDDDKVILSSISNLDGSPAIKEENKIIATLVGIEQERMINAGSQFATGGGSFAKSNPPIFLNLFILFSTSFPGNLTTEALRFIGVVIGFFQGKNVFTPENSPNLDSSIEKLVFNIYNTTFQEQNHLWAALGAKYVPSVLYKVKMISIDESLMLSFVSPISDITDAEPEVRKNATNPPKTATE